MATSTPPKVGFKRIVVPTDFSDISERALDYAKSFARYNDSNLLLVHTNEAVNPITQPEVVWYDQVVDRPSSEPRGESELEACAEALRSVEFHAKAFSCVGPVKEEILGVARREEADLIVMGTHGRTGLSRLFMGSATESLFRQATCPILVIGPHVPAVTEECWQPRNILCACDLEPDSVPTAAYADRLAQEFGADLSILHVYDNAGAVAREMQRARFSAALAPHLIGDRKPSFFHRALMIGYAVGFTIADAAMEENFDLIVMGAHSATASTSHLQSGIVPQVMARATCPVMVLPK